jgi:hypothetical protein
MVECALAAADAAKIEAKRGEATLLIVPPNCGCG